MKLNTADYSLGMAGTKQVKVVRAMAKPRPKSNAKRLPTPDCGCNG